ncbi:MAG: winged helix-turn-helix transcriptional regulator [Saprospiraceae bacterium]|jgi:biotin operon repressor|nr:winged helix-turn-helix transcriptional regulator [Saprospiraceae bacterium]
MKTRDKILKLLQKNDQISIHEMANALSVSRQYVHRLILELESDNLIVKVGLPPKVYYTLLKLTDNSHHINITYDQELFLQRHFIAIDPLGQKLEGLQAMKYWCERQNLPIEKTIEEFIQTRKKYLEYFDSESLISGLEKLKNTSGIGQVYVDELYYLDFYAIERFGKTRLGTLMHYAKQGQNKNLMTIIVNEIKQRILNLIQSKNIDAVLFVPPTINRKVQIMDVLEKYLAINLPQIQISKIKTNIIIPQKALSKIFERVANAKNTFVVPSQKSYNHILIIDDAVGSGSTINEIAAKVKNKKVAKIVSGLAITGSFKGFDVISEL